MKQETSNTITVILNAVFTALCTIIAALTVASCVFYHDIFVFWIIAVLIRKKRTDNKIQRPLLDYKEQEDVFSYLWFRFYGDGNSLFEILVVFFAIK